MAPLFALLDRKKSALLELWANRVRETVREGDVTESELRNGMPIFVDGVIEALRWAVEGGTPKPSLPEKSPIASVHGRQRFRLGFSLSSVAREYGLLRKCIVELAAHELTPDELELVAECVSTGTAEAIIEYQLQREEELRREKVEHFAFLAHELRSPLTAARTAFDTLGRKKALDASDKSVALVQRSLTKLGQLIDHGLVRARLEAGADLALEHVSLRGVFSDVESECSPAAHDRGQHLVFEVDPALTLDADARLLRSAIANLAQNALKFSGEGATITVRGNQSSGRTLVTVEDACGGLPAGMAENLFAPYVQASKDRTGFGLGLAITKHAVEAHGGTVAVQNLPAKGCLFVIDLPSIHTPAARPEAPAPRAGQDERKGEERARTDKNLRQERAKTDSELEKKETQLRASADSAVTRVREEADEAMSKARALEDGKLDREHAPEASRHVVREDRAQADTVIQEERSEADRLLAGEREALRRVVAELLRQERGDTDSALHSERGAQGKQVNAIATSLEALRSRLEDQTRAVEEAVRSRDLFLSMAAHELRTPLTALQIQVQGLLKEGQASSDVIPALFLRRLATTESHVKRLEQLVRRLLDVPGLLAGTVNLRTGPVDLSDLVREVASQMEPVARSAGCEVLLKLEPGVSGSWDRTSLERIITHLLTNALTYGHGKTVTVVLERADPVARLSFEDQGVGVDPKDHQRIFLRFERAVSESNFSGFGLGLWVVQQLVKGLGGVVSVSSQLGAGATFLVVLPLRPA